MPGSFTSSTEGAKYVSQGQALSEAKRVAPGWTTMFQGSTEGAKYDRNFISLFQSLNVILMYPGATRLASLDACPWLTYFARLALRVAWLPYLVPLEH